jgi:hypothetical protein
VTSLYDLLGTAPDATEDQLRQAYRRAARLVHPDVNPGPDADAAIRRLNQAWAVLGNPERRRRYDAEIGAGPGSTAPPPPPRPPSATREPSSWIPEPRRYRLLRPSVVILSVLALIFVVTAYAGAHDHPKPSTVPTTPSTTALNQGGPVAPEASLGGDSSASSTLVGKCILRLLGYDAIVVCNQPGAQLIEAEVATTSECPAGTAVYQLEGRSQLVCLASGGS